MRRIISRGAIVAIAGLAAATGLSTLAGCSGKAAAKPRPEVAGPTTIRDAVRLTGTIEPLDSVEIKSEVSGRIVKAPYREGDVVKKGQLILQIDAVPFQLSRDKAALQVDRANLVVKTANRELARGRELFATGIVSKDQVSDQETAVERAGLDLRDAKIALRSAELDLSRTRILAPMDGHLISFPAEVGEVASSAAGVSGGSSLGTIADPTRLKVVVEVGELDFGRLRLGMAVKVSTEGGRPRPGKVSFIPSSARASVDTKTIKVFPVQVVLDGESDGILPGMTVGVDFVFLERQVAVSVPFEALKTAGKGGSKGGAAKTASDSQNLAGSDSAMGSIRAARGEGRGDSGARKVGKAGSGRGAEAPLSATPAKSGTVLVHDPKGSLVPRSVKIGITDYRRTEILEGLVAGDTVWVQADTASKSASARGMGGPH